ncbi:MAG: hypothetical protein HOP16_09820 [Acidobacteria bacterium]|nr:hypothetical protein [Acidobacteriota bacterium]
MRHAMCVLVALISLACAGCDAFADTWPDRQHRTPPQMLADVVRWQQRVHVKQSTGQLAHECFTNVDLKAFEAADVPGEAATRIEKAADFRAVVSALRPLPRADLVAALHAARQIARPTWREMGYIDRQGRGQTEAGHTADLLIGAAIVGAFADALETPANDRR